ncbi:DUF3149 domain-containing protein [Microbulbifer salipaludis]|uniref:DUF3149 domain-containing protein n=1 Tax=Microbulbifer salipaludis TaxID=187980 RepID=A0ABS3EA91_9GAMM|nr:DUF3149 domain-containing protein [Microbulbifer salipaludis]MBN8432231.1 DUF3149 domain-containing protein [Microbulbifer salipaludis]
MDAMIDLFTSFSGLLSLGIIAFVCVMGGFFTRLALRKMNEEQAQLAETQAGQQMQDMKAA